MIKHTFLTLLLLTASMAANAQNATPAAAAPATQTSSQLTPQQAAQLKIQDDNMVQAALQTATLVDQNKAGMVWDAASDIAKQASTRAVFVNQINQDRIKLGRLQSRERKAVTRVRSNGENLPVGYYINVVFATQFANTEQPVRELVSFHLDSDKVWRVTGYTFR